MIEVTWRKKVMQNFNKIQIILIFLSCVQLNRICNDFRRVFLENLFFKTRKARSNKNFTRNTKYDVSSAFYLTYPRRIHFSEIGRRDFSNKRPDKIAQRNGPSKLTQVSILNWAWYFKGPDVRWHKSGAVFDSWLYR